ncbi:MAG: glycerol kinase, partial [Clostridia bacterium]|nr:glycerol kinase [Clostridia bacterium]
MPKYVLSVDQSTQGTKAMIFSEYGKILSRADLPHKQIINDAGWVSHDPEEIYENVLKSARMAAETAGIDKADNACRGISHQRE